jgi:hypothetical protein
LIHIYLGANTMRIFQFLFGVIIVLMGGLLLLVSSGLLTMSALDVAGSALILSAILFWGPGIAWRRNTPWLTSLFIPGSMAFAVGALLMFTGRTELGRWSYLWTLLLVALGFAFVAMYYLGPRVRGLLFTGIIVGGTGIILLAIFGSLFGTGTTADILGPVLLILFGVALAVSAVITRGGQ